MTIERIKEILEKIRDVKVAVYGDFCLDAYWIMDPDGSEVSLETGKKAEAVRKHYYSPGGASNIAANLAALKPAVIKAIGIVGNDIFGRELSSQLRSLGIDVTSLIVQPEDFNTYTFTKKYREEEEEPRIDFGNFNKRSKESDEIVIKAIRDSLQEFDVLIFNQQFPDCITRPEFIEEVNKLFLEFDDKIILLDSRHYNDRFKNIYRKTNSVEIARMNGVIHDAGDVIPIRKTSEYALAVFRQTGKPVFVTCGERGILACDHTGVHHIPGIQFLKRLDTVGAGDTVMSALALCLATGLSAAESAEFANFAAAVTVQKLFITGTAAGEEILVEAADPDFIFNPDLADDPAGSEFLPGTVIEILDHAITGSHREIRHAVFDHDGTISTLRNGWEAVMESLMIEAITGGDPGRTGQSLLAKIRGRVKDYIEKSTGVQTILQMEALVEMVGEFNLVPVPERKDKAGYKKIYNQKLLDHIKNRLSQVRENLFARDDYIIGGVVDFLNELVKKDVILYLASGTDIGYVREEADVLGYAGLFKGGIYGAVDDVSKYSKKMVIENILKENHVDGNSLVVFGDGPVEIRECRKQGGLAVGVATDESKMSGTNYRKRSRLIKAGAQIVIPDFRECGELTKLLF